VPSEPFSKIHDEIAGLANLFEHHPDLMMALV
jgi:hypothetical protein